MDVTLRSAPTLPAVRNGRIVLSMLAVLTGLGAVVMNLLDGDWAEGILFLAAAVLYAAVATRLPRLGRSLTTAALVVLAGHFAWNCFNVFVHGELFSIVFLGLIAASAALVVRAGQR